MDSNMKPQETTQENVDNLQQPHRPRTGRYGLPQMTLDTPRRLVLFGCIWVLFYLISTVVVSFIIYKNPESVCAMRICAVLQDLMSFIIPSLVMAMLVTRLPATFLAIDRKPKLLCSILAVATLMVGMPLLNYVVAINESFTLPQGLESMETSMRQAEESARATIELILGGASVGDLIMGILLVGVLAGFSEEIFFRGTFQRLLMSCRINPHIAIWAVAIVFSAIHFQFYGFIPRMLLGAYFGYLLYWSRSLWVSAIVHAANNSLYVISRWLSLQPGSTITEQETGDVSSNMFFVMLTASLLLTTAGLYLTRRTAMKQQPRA